MTRLRAAAGARTGMMLITFAAFGMVVLIFLLQRRGMFSSLHALFSHFSIRIKALERHQPNLRQLDDQIYAFYHRDRTRFFQTTAVFLLGWLADAIEVYVVCHLLGLPLVWTEAIAIESFISVAKALGIFVPGALGVQESGVVLLFEIFGLPAPVAVAYAIVRRGRETVLCPGGRGAALFRGSIVQARARSCGQGIGHRMNTPEPRNRHSTMPAIQAIIYAAGVGMRLKSAFGNKPKILLEFAGKTLLERHLQCLREVGIGRLTLVSGYQHQLIKQALLPLRRLYGLEIQQLINPDYTEGSILSLATSIPVLQAIAPNQPVLLMDGDVLYPAEVLRRLVDSPQRTALLIDREYSTADDDPVLVPINNGRPFDFVKKWRGEAEQIGESIGFFKVSPEDLPELITLTRSLSAGQGRSASYDDVLRKLVQAGRFGHEDVTGLPWTEIDFPVDVERANREVLPAIERL